MFDPGHDSLYFRKIEVEPWHSWWAWRPVKIGDNRMWLRKVYRRRIVCYVDMDRWSRYEYATIFDILRDA